MNPAETVAAISPLGFGIQAKFFWENDRFRHRIEVVSPGSVRPLLESIEGKEGELWPPSPPIHRINVCAVQSDANQGRLAMLAGSSGESHWSICVTIRDLSDRDEAPMAVDWGLVFDVACQVTRQPAWIGCRYRAMTAPIAISGKRCQALVPAQSPGCVLLVQNASIEMHVGLGALPELHCQMDRLPDNFPAILRWSYGIRYRR